MARLGRWAQATAAGACATLTAVLLTATPALAAGSTAGQPVTTGQPVPAGQPVTTGQPVPGGGLDRALAVAADLGARVLAELPAQTATTTVAATRRARSAAPATRPAPADAVVALDLAAGEAVRLAPGPGGEGELLTALDDIPGITAGRAVAYTASAVPTATGSSTDAVAYTASASPVAPAAKAGKAMAVAQPVAMTPPDDHDPVGESRYAKQWGLPWLGLPGVWTASTGAGVTVAVLDTGVDAAHADLAGRVVPGYDAVGGLADTTGRTDPNGHGTFVAGIIAAALDGTGIVGVAEDATLLPVRVLDATGAGDTATVAQGVLAAVDRGATVLNLSLGGPGEDPVLAAAIARARAAGVVVVAAVGNSYAQGNPIEIPANLPGVLAVTAIDSTGASAAFANTGPHVDLAAPGVDVWSDLPGGRYGAGDGTSFAAPYVAGAVALVRAAAPTMSGDAVADLLQATAQDDASGDGRDQVFGAGLVRPDRALASLGLLAADDGSVGAVVAGAGVEGAGSAAAPGAGSADGPGAAVGGPAGDPSDAVPGTPRRLRATVTARRVTVQWHAVAGATGYVVGVRARGAHGEAADRVRPAERAGSNGRAGSARRVGSSGRSAATWTGWRLSTVAGGAAATRVAWPVDGAASAYRVRVLAVTDTARGTWSRALTVSLP